MATTTHRSTLKTFHGPTMAEALAEVKRDLGADAVILHTRSYRVGGVMGVGTKQMVEITASADAGVIRPRRARARTEGVDAGLSLADEPINRPVGDGAFVATPPWFQPAGRAEEPVVLGRAASNRPTAPGPPVGETPKPAARPDRAEPTRAAPPVVLEKQPPAPRPTNHLLEPKPMGQMLGTPEPVPPTPSRENEAETRTQPVPEPRKAQPPASPAGEQDSNEPKAAPLVAARVRPAPTNPAAQSALEDELAAIRRLVGQVLQSSRRAEVRAARTLEPEAAVSTGPLFDLYLRLVENQVSTEVADQLTSAVRDELSPGELADSDSVRDAMLRVLARRIAVAGETKPPLRTATGRPAVVAMVGPTGVGKTTTVAKLAATYKLRHGRKVGLVTADTYRIAAVEQLRTYADIVGLPLKVALSPQDMGAAIDALSDCDVVLVDTAGRSQHDASRLGELREFLDAAAPDTFHLVLSLAASESVIRAAVERFGVLGPKRLILTKLDEAVEFGSVANLATGVGLPLSYVTTGQEVPDHIEAASAERLARLVLDGQAAWKVLAGGV